jgi:hypothetical protein
VIVVPPSQEQIPPEHGLAHSKIFQALNPQLPVGVGVLVGDGVFVGVGFGEHGPNATMSTSPDVNGIIQEQTTYITVFWIVKFWFSPVKQFWIVITVEELSPVYSTVNSVQPEHGGVVDGVGVGVIGNGVDVGFGVGVGVGGNGVVAPSKTP